MPTIRQTDYNKTHLNPDYEEDNVITDMFAGQTVSGPGYGSWGQAGTPAAAINTQQNVEGNRALERGKVLGSEANAFGDRAMQVTGSNSLNSLQTAQDAQGRAAPTANWNPANNTLAGATNRLGALDQFAASQGQGPSAAQAAANNVVNQGVGQQLALARSGRGMGGSAAAMGQAQSGMANVTANAANQAAGVAANEYQQAQQNRLNALNAAVGGSLGVAGQQAGQAQFDVNTGLAQTGLNDAYSNANNANALAWYGAGTGAKLAGMGLQQGYEQQGANTNIAHEQLGQNAYNAQADYELGQQGMEVDAQKANQASDTERDAANAGMFSSLLGAVGLSDERSKAEIRKLESINNALTAAFRGDETTRLSPGDEAEFQSWAKRNNVRDVDHPDSHYDYRGYWLENPNANIRGGVDHFPDTYKQHGHPTFSNESNYSKAYDDGGYWDYENGQEKFVPSARPQWAPPDTDALDAAYRRQSLDTVGNAPGYSYRYKDPSQPGAKPGHMVGPMAQDIERGPLGDTIVMDTPQGKMVDEGRLGMVNTSAITELNHRLRALENAFGRAA